MTGSVKMTQGCTLWACLGVQFALTLAGCSTLSGFGRTSDLKPNWAPNDNFSTNRAPSAQAPAQPLNFPAQIQKAESGPATAEYHYSLAQAYSAEGQLDRAIEEYRLTLMYDPDSAWVHARLGAEWLKKGETAQALESCRKALALDPKLTDARLMVAGILSTTQQSEEALKEYDRIIAQDRAHEEAHLFKSHVLGELNRHDESVKTLKQLVKRNAESYLGWFYLGLAERRREQWAAAIVAYRKALELKPGYSQAYLALGFLYEERSRYDDAKKVYKESFENGQDAAAANRLATLLLKEEKYTEAEPYLESLALADAEDLNVRVKLGLVQMELKKLDRAERTFTQILQQSPESDRVLYYLGNVFEEQGKSEQAMQTLAKISPDSKLFGDAQIHVAHLKKLAGRVDDSRKWIADAIVRAPRVPGLYLYQASLEDEFKNPKEAIRALEQAVEYFPEDERVRYFLGSLYDREGRADDGLAQMEALIKTNPNHAEALNYLGYTYTIRGIRLGDAEKYLKKALKLKPENGYIIDSWGWYLFTVGRVQESIVQLERAVRLKPQESTILEHLADAYVRAGFAERAAGVYADAVRFSEKAEERQKLTDKLESLRTELARTLGKSSVERMPAASPLPTK
jgi:tetratricopeptide (TPR) repeat protein